MALSDLPRLQAADMTVLGSFTIAGNAFSFGGHGLSFDPAGNGGLGSLRLSGIGGDGGPPTLSLGEISIPAVGGVASVLTAATAVPNIIAPLDTVAGSLIYNNRLILSAYSFYEGGDPELSHWRSSDKTVGNLGSPVSVGGVQNAAYYGGYMGLIPTEWQAALGGPCFTGQGAISIIPRASWGPAMYAFDPDDINVVAPPVPAQPLMYFTQSNPLHNPYTTVVPNTTWNFTQSVAGIFFPPGTRSVCVVCMMGVSEICYGTGQISNPAQDCEEISPDSHQTYDPFRTAQGYHAYPYQHRVLAFDALDLQAVKDGSLSPWAVRPYETWQLTGMGTENLSGVSRGGLAYNPTTRTIYLANGGSDNNFGGTPRIWVLEHAELTAPSSATVSSSYSVIL